MDINDIINELQHLQKQIDILDSNYKFYITFLIAIFTLVIGLIGFSGFSYLKNKTDELIANTISRRFDMLVAANNDYTVDYGEIRVIKEDLNHNKFSFSVHDKGFYLSQNVINKIIIEPLRGNKILDYKAEIKDGVMHIEFKNFEPARDEGIRWKVVYLRPEYYKDIQ